LRILLIHAKTFEYEAKEKALQAAEELGENKAGKFQNVLLSFSR